MTQVNSQSHILSLLEKAANSSSEGITISTMSEKDRPLIYANEGFVRLTGYSLEDVIGKNCRFLQGKDTGIEPVEELRRAIRNDVETTVELLNYKKDGTPFWNRLSITPLKDERGKVTHYVGIQSDITELKETKERLEKANDKLELFHKRITGELEQAKKAQQFILPTELPSNRNVQFAARYEPMDKIGGDYYDVSELKKNIFGILIADVTGHGIPAALLTFMTSFAFKDAAHNMLSPFRAVTRTNFKLVDKMPKGAFITMFYVVYDTTTRILRYTQAGHPPGYVIRKTSNEIISLSNKGGLVGVFKKDKITYEEKELELKLGDKVVLYTDAIIETRNASNDMLEISDFADFLLSKCKESISVLLNEIHQYGLDYSGNQVYDDDFTLVGFEVLS